MPEHETPFRAPRRIALFLVLALLLVGARFALDPFARPDPLEKSLRAELGQLEGKTSEEIAAALNRVVEEGEMSISINVNPTFAHAAAEGTLQIENSPANRYSQLVTITLDATGEEVYRSGLVPPNHHIQTDTLAVPLPAGDHACTALFTAYDETGLEVGTAAARITLTVLA